MSHVELGRYKYSKLANYLRLLTETENKKTGKQKQNTQKRLPVFWKRRMFESVQLIEYSVSFCYCTSWDGPRYTGFSRMVPTSTSIIEGIQLLTATYMWVMDMSNGIPFH